MKKVLVVAFIVIGSFVAGKTILPERQYTITIPAHLANPTWLLLNGQKGKVSVEEFQELLPIIGAQFNAQDTKYAYEDSVMAANAKRNAAHPDTTKTKKP